jgi:CheY-like chemotaxis protein
MNLCTNAAHAMSGSGLLEISLEEMMLEVADLPPGKKMKPGRYQKLQVSDTGVGIPADIIDSIFLPFFTTKGINEGTGMGLALVHRIVKEFGGDITVESRVGEGTVFTVFLPITQGPDNPEAANMNRRPQSGNERILMVDDEPAICKMAARILQAKGYKVISETDSEEALFRFFEKPDGFDLVITDMTMPKMSGDQLAAKILDIRPEIPLIIATGFSRQMSDAKAAEIGAKALLIKPFESATLLKTVRKLLDSSATS